VNTLPLLSFPGIVWKFFLPDLLEETVRNSAGYQSGRLNLVSINWDEHSLAELLGLWLMWASEGLIQDMAQLCDVDLLRVVDIEQKLIQMALRHRLGPPRALLDLISKLLQ
jgi:hypothetical protein